jgi:hypothetical protein
MAEETHVIKVDGFEEIEAGAADASKAVEGFGAATGRARDALGRFVSGVAEQTQVVTVATGGVYDLADAYDILPSKGDAFRDSQQRAAKAAQDLSNQLQREATEAAKLSALMAGQSPVTVQATTATMKLTEAGEATGRGFGGAGRGILTFARTLDDAKQFSNGLLPGLNAIGNNLTEISPILGLATIGIGLFASRFADIQSAAQGTQLGDFLNDWKFQFDKLVKSAGEFVGVLSKTKDAAKEAAKAVEEVGKIKSTEEKQFGAAFTKAIEQSGGGKLVTAQLEQADDLANPGRTKEQRDRANQQIAINLAAATGGNKVAIDAITKIAPNSQFSQSVGAEIAGSDPELKKAAKEIEDQQKKDQAEASAANEAYVKAVEEKAKAIAETGIGTEILLGKTPIVADVQKALKSAGYDVGDQEAIDIREKLQETVTTKNKERALKEGTTTDEASNRNLESRKDAFQKEMDAGVDRQKAEFKRKLDSAEQDDPGLKQTLALAAKIGFNTGGAGASEQAVLKTLQQKGLAGGFGAQFYAKDLAGDEQRGFISNLIKGEPDRKSQVIDSSQLANAIQAGVGGKDDSGKLTVSQLEEMNRKFDRLLQPDIGQQRPRIITRKYY